MYLLKILTDWFSFLYIFFVFKGNFYRFYLKQNTKSQHSGVNRNDRGVFLPRKTVYWDTESSA